MLNNNSLTELPEGIFDDLVNLSVLHLFGNRLQSLRSDLFDHNFRLTTLQLQNNSLRDLPSGLFDNNVNMVSLPLHSNSIRELRTGIFDNLKNLTSLELQSNRLTGVPANAFAHLGKLQQLDLSNNPITSLPSGIFNNLGGLNILRMGDMRLERLPDGVFDDLRALFRLNLAGNSLSSLSPSLFRNMRRLQSLQLENNRLSTLPDRIFEPLSTLHSLCLGGNPGKAGFIPAAIARDARTASGRTVTLDASPSGGAWGSNVTYRWETEETTVTLNTFPDFGALASFVAPATPGDLVFTLHTQGAGDAGLRCNPEARQGYTDTATVTVQVLRSCADAHHGALRLVNGEVPSEGRLEICYDDGDEDMSDGDGWGVICDDYWTDVEADVACRQLGYVGAVDNGGRSRDEQGRSLPPLYFGAPDAGVTMWLDNLMCTGKETNLLECPRFRGGQSPGSGNLSVGAHNCRPSEAVGVRCTTSLPSDMPGVAPQTPPTVRVDPVAEDSDGYYESIDVFLQFGAPVSVFTAGGTPTLSLRFGTDTDSDVPASYVGGSGSPRLLFRYVLPKPLVSQGTVRVVEDSLMAQGGVIRYVGSEVDLRLAHDGAAAPPFVASPAETVWSDEDGNDTFGDGDKVEVTLTFNEPVEVNTADGTPSVSLDYFNDDADPLFELLDTRPQAAYASGSGSAQLVFSYAVTADDGSPASIEARSLSLNGGSVRSVATTLDAFLYFSSQSISTGGTANNQRAAPTVEGTPVLGEAGADGFWTAGETVEVTVSFSESVTVDTGSGTPSIGLLLGGAQARSAGVCARLGDGGAGVRLHAGRGRGPVQRDAGAGRQPGAERRRHRVEGGQQRCCGSRTRRGRQDGGAGAGVGAGDAQCGGRADG